MPTELREEVVETTVDAVEEAVESVVETTESGSLGKAAVIVGGVILAGLGIYKAVKFVKAKRAEKNTNEHVGPTVVEVDLDSEEEDSDK